MKKKIIFIILSIYLLCAIASPMVIAEEESEQKQIFGVFTPEISFEFTKNITDVPINPLQTQETDIKVKFKLEMSPLIKWFFFKRRIGRLLLFGPGYIFRIKAAPKSNLSLTISECPAWCSAKIDPNIFDFNFDDISKNKNSAVEKTIKLEYTVNENATALEQGGIKILADFKGLWTIKAVTNSTTIPVTTAYIPNILVETESKFDIPPLQNTTIPINITNNGNGESIISVRYTIPENWTVFFDQEQFNLKVNEKKHITLTINPPKEFTNITINFLYTSRSTTGLYEGSPVSSSINFINDGSLKEELTQDIIIVGIILLVTIIILVFTLLFLRKKK